MSDTKDYLKDQFQKGQQIGSNPDISAGEAIQQVMTEIGKEYAAASDYAQCRKKRKERVSERLKEARKQCGLRQQDAAAQTGINVITLSGYEVARSEPNMEALVRLADVYGVSLDYLLCRTDEYREFHEKTDT